jgi:hypothetical protein
LQESRKKLTFLIQFQQHITMHERRGRAITGFGWQKPVTRMAPGEVIALLENDLRSARERAAAGDKPAYFCRKAKLIEQCMGKRRGRENDDGKTGLLVGYAPGQKYLYPGLPMEIAINVDRAIVEVIDLIASCRHVVMTGACCAGHPSKQIRNPYSRSPVWDGEKTAYSQNFSPHLNVLLPDDEAGQSIDGMLAGIRTETTFMGRSVGIAAQMNGTGKLYEGMMMLPMTGVPTLHYAGVPPSYMELVELYQRALADFWRAVKRVFERVEQEKIPDLKPADFGCKKRVDIETECAVIAERRMRGMGLPNYLYFNGVTGATGPAAG